MSLFNPRLAGRETATEYGPIQFDENGLAQDISQEVEEKFGNLPGYSIVEIQGDRIVPKGFDLEKGEQDEEPDESENKDTEADKEDEKDEDPSKEEKDTEEDVDASEEESADNKQVVGDKQEPVEYKDITVTDIEEHLRAAGKEVPEGNKQEKYDAYLALFE